MQTLVLFLTQILEPRNTASVVSSVIWRPFDARLAGLLDRITFHQQLVRDELNIAQAHAMNHLVDAERQERELEVKKREEEERTRDRVEEI